MTGDGKPSVFLVDDHELFRSGVRAELGDAVDVVGEASEVGAAIEMILERRPDVVLPDVHLPDGGGRAVMQGVVPRAPEVRFLALSVSDAAEDVIGVIRAGAPGLCDQDHLRARAGRRHPPGGRRRRGLLPPAGRLRPRPSQPPLGPPPTPTSTS